MCLNRQHPSNIKAWCFRRTVATREYTGPEKPTKVPASTVWTFKTPWFPNGLTVFQIGLWGSKRGIRKSWAWKSKRHTGTHPKCSVTTASIVILIMAPIQPRYTENQDYKIRSHLSAKTLSNRRTKIQAVPGENR